MIHCVLSRIERSGFLAAEHLLGGCTCSEALILIENSKEREKRIIVLFIDFAFYPL